MVDRLPSVGQLLRRWAELDPSGVGLRSADGEWTREQVLAESTARQRWLAEQLSAERPRHVGVLLENSAEFLFLLGAAALGGSVVVGLNPTRRGAALAEDVRRADCQFVVTSSAHVDLLSESDVPVHLVDAPGSSDEVHAAREVGVPADPDVDDLFMLIFTSGTSGAPKAVRVTHGKVSGPGLLLGERFGLTPGDIAYLSMPLFHSNAIMAGWGPALAGGAGLSVAKFSASGFLPDVRRFGATYVNYVGKPLAYVMATPEASDDADNPLRLVFGNEANERDIEAFGRRFGCVVVDSYSSTENAVIVQRVPEMPAGSLGRPLPGIEVLDPVTRERTPDAEFDDAGRLVNADAATGELVNTEGAGAFAGYYNDPDAEAERMRGGMYWSGDLAYRDADGFVYFAGRTADWLRVDGENLATAPIERVLLRHPAVSEAAVYAVPADDGVGDQVVAALVLVTGAELTPEGLAAFLVEQEDLGAKAWPSVVRLADSLPRTATNKVLKRELAAAGKPDGAGVWRREPRTRVFVSA